MDRLKDKMKEIFEENKLKIVIGLLITIVCLMGVLFIMMGQRNNDQNLMNQPKENVKTRDLGEHNTSSQKGHNHYQSTFIDIEGAVKQPGVYQFTNNMRVDDAVNLAGGLNRSADRKHIDLAKKLIDQQTVYIPVKGEIKGLPHNDGDSSTADDSNNSSTDSSKVNLNSADDKQLESVSGIGQKRAEKIIDYRKDHGDFKQVNDLKNVSGIGDKFLGNIKDHVTV